MFDNSQIFLSIDLGDVRVGVAIARPPSFIPVGFAAVPRSTAEQFILQTISTDKITDLIIGVPLSDTNESTTQSEKTESFIRRLEKRTSVRFHRVDEYGSSDEARERQRIVGGSVDTLSAVVILERYFEQLRRNSLT